MDQKTNSALADCYNQISEIWLSTAGIARGKIDYLYARDPPEKAEFWEAFERRCCIRAGYYARLAEQHREPAVKNDENWVPANPRSIAEYANDADKAIKRAHAPKPRRKQPDAN